MRSANGYSIICTRFGKKHVHYDWVKIQDFLRAAHGLESVDDVFWYFYQNLHKIHFEKQYREDRNGAALIGYYGLLRFVAIKEFARNKEKLLERFGSRRFVGMKRKSYCLYSIALANEKMIYL